MIILKKLISSTKIVQALMVYLFLLCNISYSFSYECDFKGLIESRYLNELLSIKFNYENLSLRDSSVALSEDPCDAPPIPIEPNDTVDDGTLDSGDCYQIPDGSTSGYYYDFYSVTLVQQETLTIELATDDFDSFLYLYDSSLNFTFDGNDDGKITKAFPAGTYYIVVSSDLTDQTGSYILKTSIRGSDPCENIVEIGLNDSVSESLDLEDCIFSGYYFYDYYWVTLMEEETLTVELVSDDFYVDLSLFDYDGNYYFNDYDSGDGTNAKISETLPAGTYFIEVTSYFAGKTGSYTLKTSTLNPQPDDKAKLTVEVVGNGKVTSNDNNINCSGGSGCTHEYDKDTKVTLKAEPAPGEKFQGWDGEGCTGVDAECAVTMDSSKTVKATFTNNTSDQTFELKVSTEGEGQGIVYSSPTGIECDSTDTSNSCTADFPVGEKVALTAQADANSEFEKWEGCDPTETSDNSDSLTITSDTCVVTMDKAKTVKAFFEAAKKKISGILKKGYIYIREDERDVKDKLKLYLKDLDNLEDIAAALTDGEDFEVTVGTKDGEIALNESYGDFNSKGKGSRLKYKDEDAKILIYTKKGKIIVKIKEELLYEDVPDNPIEVTITAGNYRFKVDGSWKKKSKEEKYTKFRGKNLSN